LIPKIVVIRGAGDLATGVASRLWNSGFSVVMLELPRPLVVRRTVSFATAIYEGSIVVEGTRAEHCPDPGNIKKMLEKRVVPVLKDPDAEMIVFLKPHILIDAIMAKKQTSTNIMHADLVIGLGPGFRAGEDVHAVVETKRGHHLGRVYYRGSAAKDTSEPGIIGVTEKRGCFALLPKAYLNLIKKSVILSKWEILLQLLIVLQFARKLMV